jgi:hypothetical protein
MPTQEDRRIKALHRQVSNTPAQRPYLFYERLDPGPGRYANAPATESRRGVLEALRKTRRS